MPKKNSKAKAQKRLEIVITIDCDSKNSKKSFDTAYCYAQNLKMVVEGMSKTTNCDLRMQQKK